MSWEKDLQRWVDAGLLDNSAAARIQQFEKDAGRGRLRWPAILAVGFGALLLCAGVLLFVSAHWDQMSPTQRFTLVLAMVAGFHLVAGLLGIKVPVMGVALHVAGTVALCAGIFLAGQIFNLEEHWPRGLMLWALGAVLARLILRQWPQALLAALLIPAWLGGEWSLATERYLGAWNIAAQGFLLLAILYFSVSQKGSNRALRLGLVWVGCLALLPFIQDVFWSGNLEYWRSRSSSLPVSLAVLGYAAAYVPALAIALIVRRRASAPIFVSAGWVLILGLLSRMQSPQQSPRNNLWLYLWVAAGACALCWWGVHDNRKLFINYGTVIFALNLVVFYYSDVLDKMGRSMGLILLGVLFLAGGWVLNRLRSDLINRAAAIGGSQ